ncbi:MAG TPA: dodecin family protein [Deltaproteobacteria bacterium]|nr:dodecin family protein [Deltaproteobacteria bacterium]HPP79616.1 dodecin family protein [Deltaproteobacteria bacterium]
MAEREYQVIELVGTSPVSWEKAAETAVAEASETLTDLRIAEVVRLDMHADEEGRPLFRARLRVSFRYHMIFSLTPKYHQKGARW